MHEIILSSLVVFEMHKSFFLWIYSGLLDYKSSGCGLQDWLLRLKSNEVMNFCICMWQKWSEALWLFHSGRRDECCFSKSNVPVMWCYECDASEWCCSESLRGFGRLFSTVVKQVLLVQHVCVRLEFKCLVLLCRVDECYRASARSFYFPTAHKEQKDLNTENKLYMREEQRHPSS